MLPGGQGKLLMSAMTIRHHNSSIRVCFSFNIGRCNTDGFPVVTQIEAATVSGKLIKNT